ncbi:MAG: hypothetical protein KJ070_06600 [Verrucomicrobia bacterium]|nr:hypothetical protein [Verrucomicrobiota bacterium]
MNRIHQEVHAQFGRQLLTAWLTFRVMGQESCRILLRTYRRQRLNCGDQQLDEKYRAPLAMFYLEELSYKEMAEVLSLPIGTIMSRMSRGNPFLIAAQVGQQQRLTGLADASDFPHSEWKATERTVQARVILRLASRIARARNEVQAARLVRALRAEAARLADVARLDQPDAREDEVWAFTSATTPIQKRTSSRNHSRPQPRKNSKELWRTGRSSTRENSTFLPRRFLCRRIVGQR